MIDILAFEVSSIEELRKMIDQIARDLVNDRICKCHPKSDDKDVYKMFNTNSCSTVNITTVISKIAYKKHLSYNDAEKWIESITMTYPMAALSILLKEFAELRNSRYKDKLEDCNTVYIFDTISGQIKEIPTSKIKSFNTFAAFITYGDALLACQLFKDRIENIYAK